MLNFIAKWRARFRRRAANKDIVCAKEFRLVDDDGITRAAFRLDAEGDPHLSILDADCRTAVEINPLGIGLLEKGTGIGFFREDGTPALAILDARGLVLRGGTGETEVSVGFLGDAPTVMVCDETGRPRAGATILEGVARVFAFDEFGNRVSLDEQDEQDELPDFLTGQHN